MSDISAVAAFSGGLLSFLSPCILPMVPVYLATLYGPGIAAGARGVRVPLLLHSLSFVLGFSLIYTALGALAGVTGYAVNLSITVMNRVAGGVMVAFGVILLAALKIPWLNYEKRLALSPGSRTGYLRSLLIGAAFALGWTACVGPILGGVLMLAAAAATAWKGAGLLLLYCLGLGLPFLLLGAAFDSVMPLIKRIQRYSRIIQVISGISLIGIGILAFTGNLTWFAALAG